MSESKYRIKLLVIDILERMNDWEELTICTDKDGVTLYEGLPEDVPPSLFNDAITGIGESAETVLLYINP